MKCPSTTNDSNDDAVVVTRTSGRRHRTATTRSSPSPSPMNNSATLADAKANFVSAVKRAVSVLMDQCGYSRERATAALLREIGRGDAAPPQQEEIFRTMQAHGMGIEEAGRALTVSRALQREIAARNISEVEAINDLSSRLSLANLVRMEGPSSSTLSSSAPVRIQPVPVLIERAVAAGQAPRPKTAITTATTTNTSFTTAARKAKSLNKKEKPSSKAANAGSRKRSIDDINNNPQPDNNKNAAPPNFSSRERSDSVSEAVNAKLAENAKDDESTNTNGAPAVAAAAVRSKRSRVEEPDVGPNALKRSRGSLGDL